MDGILLVDKPDGWTSFDVVNYVRRRVAGILGKKPRNVKVGHTGTLDPAATGLLVLCVGKYTKKVPEMIKQDKTYQVELTLGSKSTTGDREGAISVVSDTVPTGEDVKHTIEKFIGEISQVPPAHSAIKVNGKRAYELARAGKEVKMAPRTVYIHSITDLEYEYPKVKLTAKVGSGTYIRSLAEDIGADLGVGAYMSALRRVAVGDYNIKKAVVVGDITEEFLQKSLALSEK